MTEIINTINNSTNQNPIAEISSLLPANSSKLERDIEAVIAKRFASLEIVNRKIFNQDECAGNLLEYLACLLSLDAWESSWNSDKRRQAVKNSLSIHRKKGTIHALKKALENFSYQSEITEWFQPGGDAEKPYTFAINLIRDNETLSSDIAGELKKINSVVEDVKNVRSHLRGVKIDTQSYYGFYIGCCTNVGQTFTLYPYLTKEKEVLSNYTFGAAVISKNTITFGPELISEAEAPFRLNVGAEVTVSETITLKTGSV